MLRGRDNGHGKEKKVVVSGPRMKETVSFLFFFYLRSSL